MIIYRITENLELALKHNWNDIVGYRRKKKRKLALFMNYFKDILSTSDHVCVNKKLGYFGS